MVEPVVGGISTKEVEKVEPKDDFVSLSDPRRRRTQVWNVILGLVRCEGYCVFFLIHAWPNVIKPLTLVIYECGLFLESLSNLF